MENILKIFALTLATILLMGLVWNLNPRLPRFPGDIFLNKFGFSIYIPFTSAIVVSVILTILFNFFRR